MRLRQPLTMSAKTAVTHIAAPSTELNYAQINHSCGVELHRKFSGCRSWTDRRGSSRNLYRVDRKQSSKRYVLEHAFYIASPIRRYRYDQSECTIQRYHLSSDQPRVFLHYSGIHLRRYQSHRHSNVSWQLLRCPILNSGNRK